MNRADWLRQARAFRVLANYEAALASEQLSPSTTLEEYSAHLIAKGAYNLLTVQCRDEWKLAYDPDAVLLPALKARLELADHCTRNHLKENPC